MNDVTTLILPEIREILEKHDREALRHAMAQLHPADIADIIARLDPKEAGMVFESLIEKTRVRTFEHLEEPGRRRRLDAVGRGKMVRIIEEMSAEDRADFIRSAPDRTAESILPLLARAERNDVRKLAACEEGTAGAVMTTEYASLPGCTTLRELGLARPDQDIMDTRRQPLIKMPVDADQEEVARAMQKHDFLALPIVDAEERLVGIVTQDDVIDVLEEEATEHVQRMGAVEPIDTPYLRAGIWAPAWRPGTALRHCQATLERLVSKVFYREVGMGAALGIALGVVGYFRALMWGNGQLVGLAVALSLAAIVAVGSIVGARLPLLFKRFRLDPGEASSPFVASLADVVGIVVYFNIARSLIPIPVS